LSILTPKNKDKRQKDSQTKTNCQPAKTSCQLLRVKNTSGTATRVNSTVCALLPIGKVIRGNEPCWKPLTKTVNTL
jgi:hypothetical protein